MVWNWTPYALPLFAASVIYIVVAVLGWRRRGPGVTAFVVLLGLVSIWSAASGFEILSASLPQKLLWARVEYIGIVLAPVTWLVFSLQYAGRVRRPGYPLLALLFAVPLTTLALLWNSTATGLIWRSAGLSDGPGFDLLRLSYGPWFWVHTTYSYLLWAAATVILLLAMRRSPYLYRKQGLAVALAVVSPWVLNVLYVSGVVALDTTPFGFTLTGVAMFWTLARQQFLDIMPVARARIVESMHDGVIVLDDEDRIIDLNPAAVTIIGEPASSVIGRGFDAVFSGRVELHELTGEDNELQLEAVLTGDDDPRSFELRSWPLFDRGDEPCGRLMVFRDITRQKRAEDALQGSQERLRVVIEQMPAVLWTTDGDLRFTQMLGAGLQQLRVPPDAASGMDLFEFYGTIDNTHPAIAAHLRALNGSPTTYSVEWFGRDFECHVEPLIDSRGTPCGIIGVGLDVTERQDLQEQLRQSQKMEAIGRMAGGVAHDFNNLLTAVAGYAQLAHEDLEALEQDPSAIAKLRRDLEAIGHASERATSITAQLLAFSRRQVLQPRLLKLNETLEDMDKMLRRLIGSHIELVAYLNPECDLVKVDPVQVQQVLINLVLNSRDAMPNGGEITLETMNLELSEGRTVAYDVVEPGQYVLLSVADDGFGMDERTRAHLFEPFFTTKEEGKGTGLGLSTVYGIIKQTGGYIEVDSKVGEGTTFKIYFPAADPEEMEESARPRETQAPHLRGDETVLLVEDEEMVRELASRVLNGHGYLVLEAESGAEALEMCRRHEGPVDVLVTDVVMPGMNGSELASRIANIVPDAAVLFISGYTGGALVEHGVLQDGTNFLQKPFSPHRFMRTVREVLDARD
jgi:PAS domain S-box-containing protein